MAEPDFVAELESKVRSLLRPQKRGPKVKAASAGEQMHLGVEWTLSNYATTRCVRPLFSVPFLRPFSPSPFLPPLRFPPKRATSASAATG